MQSSLNDDTDSRTRSQELATSSAPVGTELQLVDVMMTTYRHRLLKIHKLVSKSLPVMLVQRVLGGIRSKDIGIMTKHPRRLL